jgi:hypothetical protein
VTIKIFVTGEPNGKALFDLTVRIANVQNVAGDSLLSFFWQTNTADASPSRAFAHSDGMLVISLEGTTLTADLEPERFTISRGAFRCVLTVVHPTGFSV